MKVLEMEEAESLVGTKRVVTKSESNVGARGLTQALSQRNYLVKIVIVAALAILFLAFLSGTGQSQVEGNSQAKNHTSSGLDMEMENDKGIDIKSNSNSNIDSTGITDIEHPADTSTNINDADGEAISQPVTTSTQTATPIDNTNDAASQAEEEPHPINVYSKFATFQPLKHLPLPDEDTAKELADQWGHWHFWDDEEDDRPTDDFLSNYPNKDVPNDAFPEMAWQADAVFVNHFLMDAGKLVARAVEAIYAEYGYAGDQMTPEQWAERPKKVFRWLLSEGMDLSSLPGDFQSPKRLGGRGGWMPKRSHDGLIRRLLHAIMTSDTFTVVLGGHSVAAGSG